MISTWQPSKTNDSAINNALLKHFAELGARALENPIDLTTLVSKEQQQQAHPWLALKEEAWQDSIKQLEIAALFPLAAFFTLAEMQLAGWQCGAKNPAIWLFRYLRKQQQQPNKEKIQKLKQLTDNRFIPYGSVL